ncbi:type I restriction enzyme, S subunit [Pseudomonas sp. IT-196MI5]|uniref:restriction endonuclease subunit S n=1 Tax=Pseudomonas sp. IT-196MI5 TaxID=3026440 RepID=UPI0039E1220B
MNIPRPPQWKEIVLGDYIDVSRGASPRPKGDPRYFGGSIPWISIRDINAEKGKFLTKTSEGVTEAGADKSRLIQPGGLILSNSASVCIPKILKIAGCIHDGFVTFPNIEEHFCANYFYYYFDWLRPAVIDKHKQGVTQVNLNTEIIRSFTVPIPPFPEQIRIAKKLDELLFQVDTLKARIDAAPTLLKRFRQSVLAAAVSGRLTNEWREAFPNAKAIDIPSEKELELGAIETKEKYFNAPSAWQWAKFGVAVSLINGDRGKNYPNKSEYVEQGIPFINTGHIDPNGTLSADRMNFITKKKFDSLGSGKIKNGDLVYCLRGATMGKTAFVDPLTEGAIASSLVIVRTSNLLLPRFTYLFLTSPQGKNLISQFDNGSAQPNLSAGSLASYPIAIPPLAEQSEIVRRVEQLFAFADQLEAKVTAAKTHIDHLTQSILAKAFRGELVPQDPNDEPASVLLERIKAQRIAASKDKRARKNA